MHKTSTPNSYIGEYKRNDTQTNNIQEKLLALDVESSAAKKMFSPIMFDVSQKVVDKIVDFAKSI